MKKLVLATAILAIGAVVAQAAVIEMNRFSNSDHSSPDQGSFPATGWVSTDGGTTTNATAVYDVSTFITDDVASPQPLAYTVTGLDIDGVGGENDQIVVNFIVSGVGGNLQTKWDTSGTPQPGAAGWLSAGGVTLNVSGEYVQFDFASLSVDLNGGTGNGSGTFDGFSEAGIGAFNSVGETAVANGLALEYVADGSKVIDLTGGGLDSNLQVIYDTSLGAVGAWRPEAWSFQVTAIPEPATLGLVMAFGGGILFIRRKLMM